MSDQLLKIKSEIMADPENEAYTKNHIEPLYMANPSARVCIIGQAPGKKAQDTHRCFNDKSGERLREWLGIDEATFYHSGFVSVIPMDFYYPGKAKTGDKPPRKDFADKWHPKLLAEMPNMSLIVLVGSYAQSHYLNKKGYRTLTENVKHYEEFLPKYWPIVHPSPLNGRWLKKNQWFEEDVVPKLQARVRELKHEFDSEN